MRVTKSGKVRSKGRKVSFYPEGIGMLRPRRMTHTQNIDTPLVSDIVISFMFHPDHMYCYSLNVKGLGFSNPPTFPGFVIFGSFSIITNPSSCVISSLVITGKVTGNWIMANT